MQYRIVAESEYDEECPVLLSFDFQPAHDVGIDIYDIMYIVKHLDKETLSLLPDSVRASGLCII